MKKTSVIIDAFLTFAATFLLAAAVIGYFARDTLAVTISAAIVALAATFFTGKLSAHRARPKKLRQKQKEILNKFLFSMPDYAYDFTLNAIRRKREPIERDGLTIARKTAFSVKLTPQKISCAELASVYAAAAKNECSRLVILSAYGAQADAAEFCGLLGTPAAEIWDFAKVYDFYSHLGCAPTESLKLASGKKKFGAVLSGALARENARRYLFSAVITLLFARFMPYSVFYVVIASVSLTLALLSRLNITEKLKAKKRNG